MLAAALGGTVSSLDSGSSLCSGCIVHRLSPAKCLALEGGTEGIWHRWHLALKG